jgi:hypothetical protein
MESKFGKHLGSQETTSPTATPCCEESRWLYQLWNFLLKRRDLAGQAVWERLIEEKPELSRDEVIMRLWRRIRHTNCTAEATACYLSKHQSSVRYHEILVFDWLLARYDLPQARLVWVPEPTIPARRVAASLSWALLMAMIAAATLGLGWLSESQDWFIVRAVAVAAAYAVPLIVLWRICKVPISPRDVSAVQTFVPRLAATSAVGLFVLASSDEMTTRLLSLADGHWWRLPLIAGAVFALAFGYLLLEMARRIQPTPRLGELASRGGHLMALGVAHATALVTLGWPMLTQRGAPLPRPGLEAAACLVTFVFAIGLVLNVIWAEEPVTHPL